MDSKIEPVAWLHKPTGGVVDPLAKGLLVKRFSEELQRDVSVDFEELVPASALLAAEQRGREWAAQKLDRRITQIANDYGDYEPDTNATNLPDDWELVCQELENLAVAIRKGE